MRRLLALLAILSLGLAPAACRQKPEGTVRVLVIGGEPKLRDPAAGPLSPADAVLVGNVAQGLVSFDASGNIVPGLAERWNVSDDGLSYIFRIASAQWPDGRKITADQIARLLKRSIGARSRNPLKDSLGAITDIVSMTDRVIEIHLGAPRPNLLSLLAQPEMAIVRGGVGSGPFVLSPQRGP
ncbi:MAG TPA: ABC transporter substrate-binding protein, partial [Sphingomicrobium sp.]